MIAAEAGSAKGPGLVQSCLWQWLRGSGLERCDLERELDGWQLRGTILAGGDGGPFEVRYTVSCDAAWRTRRAGITLRSGGAQRALTIVAEAGRWTVAGREIAEVRGAIDIDLSWSPSTNTLPIRRLRPEPGAATGTIVAAWVRFPSLAIEPLEQEYQRLDDRRYRYSSRGGAFTAVVEVDQHGLVIDYEGVWRRAQET